LFSDYIDKVSRKNKSQSRILILTDKSVLVLSGTGVSLEVRSQFPISELVGVSLSRDCADLAVLHHCKAYDIFFASNKRAEIMYNLLGLYHHITGQPLEWKYGET